MNEEKVKKIITKVFWKVFLVILVGFTALYISEATGYYEFEQHNKKVMTEEKIKQFEKDVESGKKIDINNYMVVEENNYESKLSKMGDNMSKEIEKAVTKGLEQTFNFLGSILS